MRLSASRRRRGFFLADAVVGLAIVTILATALTVVAWRQNRTARTLADSRAAIRLAEQVLSYIQAGQSAPEIAPAQVEFRWLKSDAPAGMQWLEVTVVVQAQRESLTGLVPAGGGGGGP